MQHCEPQVRLSPPRREADDIVPQANSIEKVVLAVGAVDAGCATASEIADVLGVTERQGDYYANAACSLGLLRKSDVGQWDVTELGHRAANADVNELVDILTDQLAQDENVVTYLENGEAALMDDWEQRGDISSSTLKRRVATAKAWSDFYTSSRDKQVAILAHQGMLISQIRTRPKPRKPSLRGRYCQSCGIALPYAATSSQCDYCKETT